MAEWVVEPHPHYPLCNMDPQFKPSNKPAAFLAAVVLLMILAFGWMTNSRNAANAHLQQEISLRNALQSEMVITKDKLGRETAEKLTLQTDVKTLVDMKDKLSADKQQLIELVQRQDKDHKLIVAALVKTKVVVKEIRSEKPAVLTDSSASFVVATDSIGYEATVTGVHVDSAKVPSLVVRNLVIPNSSEISFQWGEKKEGYPISFKITNSNPLFHTQNVESYAIPQLTKAEVRPNFFEGLSLTLKNGKTPFVIGVSAGALGVLLLTGALH